MFVSQNKQVTSKFPSTRTCIQTKSKEMPKTPGGAVSGKNMTPKVALTTESQKVVSLDKVKPKPMPEVKLSTRAKASGTVSATNCRGKAATLNRGSPHFLLTSRSSRPSSSKIFDYDLSQVEQRYFDKFHNPMKSVPQNELQLLQSGQRATYLETRYERTPDKKYNYPEATSWRYGWFHHKAPL